VTATLLTHFARAAEYRFLSIVLSPPAAGRRKSLDELAPSVRFEDGFDVAALLLPHDEESSLEAFKVIGQAGRVSVCASDYVEDGYADKGPIIGDVAGFYGAFGFEPSLPENPDHFGNLFEFLAFLALKQAWCLEDGHPEQARIAEDAEQKLLAEHVHPYLGRFAERLSEFAGAVYAPVAGYVGDYAGRWQDTTVPMREVEL